MELAWEALVFWNKKQQLIVKWLEEDYNSFSSIGRLEKLDLDDKQKELLKQYKEIKEEGDRTRDAYIKSLNKIKLRDILDVIIEPILDKYKVYYEEKYEYVLRQKRQKYIDDMTKFYKKKYPRLDIKVEAPF